MFKEKNIHLVFEWSLILKALFAAFEIIGGVLTYFVSQQFVLRVVTLATQGELSEDAHDFISNYLLHTAQSLSINSQHFVALFLLGHGAIKLFMIIGLLREKLWYYPASIVVFGFFIISQLYRFSSTHSLFLLLITIVDLIVIILTIHEYKYLRYNKNKAVI